MFSVLIVMLFESVCAEQKESPTASLVRVKDRAIVEASREITSRPYWLKTKFHAYRAMEAGAE